VDPLTHTLVGANLAATRLGEKTRLAAAALIVGANLPDVDAILYFTGHDDLARGFRRGWTHGVLAVVVLPVLLTALLWAYDRVASPRRGGASVNLRWLLTLSFIAILTHPFLDWLNNYGMRWLMPFRGTWFYGDAVFIMDPVLWLILGFGWLAGRRPTPSMIAVFIACVAALMYVVGRRAPTNLLIVAVVAALLFIALIWRTDLRIAKPALILACCYIGARLLIHYATAVDVRRTIGEPVQRLMVAPHPMDPTRWEVVAQTGDVYRYGRYSWRSTPRLSLAADPIPVASPSPEWEAAKRHPSVWGFVTWMRFPWYQVEKTAQGSLVHIGDARYAVRRGRSFGDTSVLIPYSASPPQSR